MSNYLDDYGVAEARREKILKRVVLAAVVLSAAGGLLYWQFKDFREERQVKTFFERLQAKDYQSAYAMWGCTVEKPCPQYSFEKFMEDWGPNNPRGDASAARMESERSCEEGIIQTLNIGGEEIWLWVDRSDRVLSYAPWPVCNPRLPPGSTSSPTG